MSKDRFKPSRIVLKSLNNWTAVLRPCLIYEPKLPDGNNPEIKRYRLEKDRATIAQCTGIVTLTKDSLEELLNLNRSEEVKKHYRTQQLSLF